ncbi:fasciclin domain-containing protein [Clostridioides difficile]
MTMTIWSLRRLFYNYLIYILLKMWKINIILNNKEITMLNGKKAKITFKGNNVFINNAKVIITDIDDENGIIYVIDTVLIP